MAHFYGSMDGSARTTATRCGTKSSGITAHIRGWDNGVEISGYHDTDTGNDVFIIRMTGGSNRKSVRNAYVGYVTTDDDGNVLFQPVDGAAISEKE
jgi:hypothetical protein